MLLSIPFVSGWIICFIAICMCFYKLFAQKDVFYQEPSAAKTTLAHVVFHYKVTLGTLILLLISTFVLNSTRDREMAFGTFALSCAVFTVVASLTKTESEIRLHRGLALLCAFVAIFAITSTLLSANSRWQYVRNVR